MEANDALITILKKSHEEALNGLTISGEEVQTYMNDKVYELTHGMDTYCVAESL